MTNITKNTSGQYVYAVVTAASGGAAVTSGVTCNVSKDGGAAGSSANTPSHLAQGLWVLELSQAETNCDEGAVVFHDSGSSASPVGVFFTTSAVERTDAGIAEAVWNAARSSYTTGSTFGEALDATISSRAAAATALTSATWTNARAAALDNLDAAVSGCSTHDAADVWTSGTRTLTGAVSLTAAAVDAIWDEDLNAHSTSGSAGAILDDLDGLTNDSIADQVWNELLDGHVTTGSAGKVLSDTSSISPSAIADAVWDEDQSGHTDAGTFGLYLDAAVTSRAPSATALSTATWTSARASNLDNLDATVSTRAPASTALSSSTWTNGRAALIDNLDAAVTTRSSHSAADVWNNGTRTLTSVGSVTVSSIAANAVNASALAADALAEIADAVWDEAQDGHTDSGTFGEYLDAVVSTRAAAATALSTAQWTNARAVKLDNLDAAVSSRPAASAIADAVWDEVMSGHTDAGSAGAYVNDINDGTLAADVADAVWDEAQADHTDAGSFGLYLDAVVSDVSAPTAAAVADAVWNEAQADHTSAGSFGVIATEIAEILTDTGTTIPATLSGLNDLSSSDVSSAVWDAATSGFNDAGSFGLALGGLTVPTAGDVADAVWDEAQADHTSSNTFGAYLNAAVSTRAAAATALTSATWTNARAALLDNLDAAVSSRSSHDAADVWAAGTRTLTGLGTGVAATVADAVWDEDQSTHTDAGTFGAYLNAAVTSRSSHSAADVWSSGTRTLSAGVDLTTGAVDAIWDEPLDGHTTEGTAGEVLTDAGA